jgi:hypothetical protein
LALAVCLGALSACTSGGTQQPPPTSTILACTSDAECGSLVPAQKCDLTRRECVCTTDLMCPIAAPYCNVLTGRCVEKLAGCSASSCPTGQYCDPSKRTCEPVLGFCDSCDNDAECGTGNRCITHPDFAAISRTFCASACGTGNSCPEGQECRDTTAGVKQCVPKGSLCTGDVTCLPDLFTNCTSDNDCTGAANQKCDTDIGKCVAATTVCSPGQTCDPRTRSCVPECATDDQCKARLGDGFICLQRACRPANECTKDEQCSIDQFCLKDSANPNGIGRCAPTCQTDVNCPIGHRCVAGAGGRKSCVNSCADNSDCQLNEICNAGVCEGGHCQVKAVCTFGENCINNVCVKEPNNCTVCTGGGAGSCPGGGGCKPVAFNMACKTTTCSVGTKICEPGASSGCGTDPLCYCIVNRCLTQCSGDADCPQGFSCDTLPGGNYCSPAGDGLYCVTPP